MCVVTDRTSHQKMIQDNNNTTDQLGVKSYSKIHFSIVLTLTIGGRAINMSDHLAMTRTLSCPAGFCQNEHNK